MDGQADRPSTREGASQSPIQDGIDNLCDSGFTLRTRSDEQNRACHTYLRDL
jgi:hypothetical protein